MEPITVWNQPSRLAFDVSAQPDPLRELSPYRNLRTPHLDGYFKSEHGEFQLVALARGRTCFAEPPGIPIASHRNSIGGFGPTG